MTNPLQLEISQYLYIFVWCIAVIQIWRVSEKLRNFIAPIKRVNRAIVGHKVRNGIVFKDRLQKILSKYQNSSKKGTYFIFRNDCLVDLEIVRFLNKNNFKLTRSAPDENNEFYIEVYK